MFTDSVFRCFQSEASGTLVGRTFMSGEDSNSVYSYSDDKKAILNKFLATKSRKPVFYISEAVQLLGIHGTAIDLGCGVQA